jgi:lysophospholipase L1-like esterase
MAGEFTLTGSVTQRLADGSDGGTVEDLAALVGLTGQFVSNIPAGKPIPVDGGVMYVPPRDWIVDSGGQLREVLPDGSTSTNVGITLTANDPTFELTNPLQWKVAPGRFTLGGRTFRLASWWFDAPAPGWTGTIDELTPVPGIQLLGGTRGPRGYSFGGLERTADTLQGVDENDVPRGPAVDISDLIFNGTFDSLTDATAVGKALGRASSTAGARRAISAADEAALGAFRPLMMKMDRAQDDAVIVVAADSLANELTEYSYLTLSFLATRFPGYTVKYYLWDAPALANPGNDVGYQAVVTVQTGNGSKINPTTGVAPVLTMWNAAVAGSTTGYFQGSRFDAAFTGKGADLVLCGYGHNQGGPISTDSLRQFQRNKLIAFVDDVAAANPLAGVALLLTNPSIDNPPAAPGRPISWVLQRNAQFEIAARMRGWGLIDGCKAFLDNPNWAAQWISSDGLHPNGVGEIVLAGLITDGMDRASQYRGASQGHVPAPRRQLFRNPQFSAWAGTLPDGVSAGTGVTITKETTDYKTGTCAMKVTANSATSGQVFATIAFTADQLGVKGGFENTFKTIRVVLKVPAANTDVARIWVQDTPHGSASAMVTDVDSTCRDRYHAEYVTMWFGPNSTGGQIELCPRTSGTSTNYILVDSVEIYEGAVPCAGSSLDTLGSLATNDGDYIKRVGGAYVGRSVAQLQSDLAISPEYVAVGEACLPPNAINNAISMTSGQMAIGYFTALQTITINNIAAATGSTAAVATPTICRMGVYSVDGSNNLTLLAGTTNDTSLFAGAGTEYSRALSSAVTLTAGTQYAYGVLIVSASAMPNIMGQLALGSQNQFFRATNKRSHSSSIRAGLTDLPSSVLDANVGSKNGIPFILGTT